MSINLGVTETLHKTEKPEEFTEKLGRLSTQQLLPQTDLGVEPVDPIALKRIGELHPTPKPLNYRKIV